MILFILYNYTISLVLGELAGIISNVSNSTALINEQIPQLSTLGT